MTSKRHSLLTAMLLIALAIPAQAQFSTTGDDPAYIHWMKMDTPSFRIIYPAGMDSLAKSYGTELEAARWPLSLSSGYLIGESYPRTKMPVVLHAYNTIPNASVTWAPKRMDMFTVPDAFGPTPYTWETSLAIHEGRHAAQMQFGAAGKYKVLKVLTGEMLSGGLAGVFPGLTILEGDAVVAETALTESGRGRQGSFLNYMMPAFDNGDWRDYWQWSYDSQKRYTPDYYRVGYMLISGTRVFFDDPLFTKDYFRSAVRTPRFGNLQKTVKKASGMKFRDTFRAIEEKYHDIWTAEANARAPFIQEHQMTQTPHLYMTYRGGTFDKDGNMFAISSGIEKTSCLVCLKPDGTEERIRSFSSNTSPLVYDPVKDRIYWTEAISDIRWSLGGSSRVRYIEVSDPQRFHNLTREDNKYFNCAPSPDGRTVATCEYPAAGGSRLVILNAEDGSVVRAFMAPDGMQLTEAAWIGERLFAAGVTEKGMGIYEVEGTGNDGKADLRTLAAPQPVELLNLGTWPESNLLYFVCDRTGVKELYTLDADSAVLTQKTSTRYGISSPVLNPSADTLYYSAVAASEKPETYLKGSMVYSAAVSSLVSRTAEFSDIHHYPVADALSMQEKALQEAAPDSLRTQKEWEFSQPKKYSKIRFPHVHSWAPIYFNYNTVDEISMDYYYQTASIGATALFQNLFSTGYGFVGYSLHEDPTDSKKWRNSLHFSYVYTGLYPVIELSGDFNDRSREKIVRVLGTRDEKTTYWTAGGYIDNSEYFKGTAKVYIPFRFNSGGLTRGFIPQVKYSVMNDLYDDSIYKWKYGKRKDGSEGYIQDGTLLAGSSSLLSTFDCSIRGYVLRKTATSQVFPRLGIGAETGFHCLPGHDKAYSNSMYFYTYGYLPGFTQTQGLKLTAGVESRLGNDKYSFMDAMLSTTPRGFEGTNIVSIMNKNASSRVKVTADYAIPFLAVDWSWLSPVAYIRNFVLTPFCDFSYLSYRSTPDLKLNESGIKGGTMMSAGFDLTVHLGNFLWMPYDTEFGVRYARNSWNNVQELSVTGLDQNYIGVLFSIDM